MNTRHPSIARRILFGTLALAAIGSCPQKALAQTFDWNVNSGGSWITDTNWAPVVAGDWPKDAGDVANLNFNLTVAVQILLNAPITLGALTIGDTDASHTYTLSNGVGGSLTFDNGGSTATLTESATGLSDLITATLNTAGDLNIVNANTTAGRTFTLSGPLTSSAVAGTQTVTFSQSSTNAAVLMSGSITNGLTGGTIAVNKAGSGTLTFGSVNGYTGGTTLSAGTIVGNAANSLTGAFAQGGGTLRINNYALAASPTAVDVATGAIVNAGAGTFTMNSNAVTGNAVAVALGALNVSGNYAIRAGSNGTALATATIFTLNAPLNISGAPIITSTSDTNASVTIGGLTTLNSDVTIAGTTTFRFSTLAEDATPRKITRTGTGLLNMQGAANYSGGTDVLGGVVQFSTTGASGSGLIQVGDTAGTANAEIRVVGGATVANDITVRSGSTGTAKIAHDTTTSGTGTYSGTITLQKNTIFENASGASSGTARLDVTGRVTGADVKITVTRGAGANSHLVHFSNALNDFGFAAPTDDAITVGNGVFLATSDAALGAAGNNLTLASAGSIFRADGTFTTTRKLTFNTAGAAVDATTGNELTLSANGQIAGTAAFAKGAAAGTVTITGDNSARTADSRVTGGTLRISSSANIGTASAVTLSGGTFDLRNDASTVFTNNLTVTASSTINVDQAVGGTGAGNTHTVGTVTISAGTLTATNAAANNYSLTTGAVTLTGATGGITNNLGGTGVLTIPSIRLNSLLPGTFTLGGTGNTVVSGNLTQTGGGALSIIKSGTGTATLNGTASYTGTTAITAGTLRVPAAAALTAGTVSVGPGTLSLVNDSSTSYPYNLFVTGTGFVNVDRAVGGSGTGNTHTLGTITLATQNFTFTGSNDYSLTTGAVTVTDSGTLTNNISGTGVLTIPSITVNNAAAKTLTLRGTGSTIVTGGILQTGAGVYSLLKLDPGTVTLNAASTFTGNVNIGNTTTTGGTLRLGAAGAIPNNTLSVLSGTLDMNGFALTPTSIVLGGGPTATSANINTNGGTLTLGGNVTYNTVGGFLGAFINGPVSLGGATRTFTVADTAAADPDLTITGAVSDGGGGFGVIKAGTGKLAFDAASSFKNLSVTSGTVSGTGTITLYDDVAPLTLRNNTISSNIVLTGAAGAAITFDLTSNGTGTISGQLDLGSNTRIFNVPNGTGTPDLNVSGVLTGNTDWSLAGGGRLQLAGAAPNTYAGTVTVTSGTLFLAKTAGTTAITGNVLVNGGSLLYADQGNNQIADTASVTLDFGTVAFSPNSGNGNASETLANFTMNGGTFRTAVGTPAGPHSQLVFTGTFTINGGDFAINSFSSLTANKFVINGGANVIGANDPAEFNTLTIGAGGLEVTGGQMKMNLSTNPAALGGRIVLGGNVTSFASPFEAGIFGGLNDPFGTRTIDIGAGPRTFTIADGDALNDFRIDFNITGDGTLVKEGDGTLALNGLIGTGTTSVTANDGIITIAQSQTLEALVIGAGATVVLLEDLFPAPAGLVAAEAPVTSALVDDSGAPLAGVAPAGFEDTTQVAAVPEPGAFGLMAAGVLGMLSRRRGRPR